MNKQFGKIKRIGTAILAVMLLCCAFPAGCGRYEETGQLSEQTVQEDKADSFRHNPDLIYNTEHCDGRDHVDHHRGSGYVF